MKIIEILEDKDTLELPDIKVGDEVKIGKWKNRKATVKGFKKDKKDNHPILKTTKGDTKLFKLRISKIEEYVKDLDTPIYKNPSRQQFKVLMKKIKEMRGITTDDGILFVWNAFFATHSDMMSHLGLKNRNIYDTYYFYIDPTESLGLGILIKGYEIEATFNSSEDIKQPKEYATLRRAIGIRSVGLGKLEVDEAFDQPLPLKWVSSPGGTWKTAEFKIDNFRIIVDFSKKIVGSNEWAVTFGSPETVLGRSAKANVGPKTILIFSTVLKAMDEFFQKENPEKIIFSASTDALENLYKKMIRYINSKGKYHAELVPDFPGARETFHYEITKR